MAGRKSATAAAITTASVPPPSAASASASIASRSCRAEVTRTTRLPAGSGSDTFAATTVTLAPRATAVSAKA